MKSRVGSKGTAQAQSVQHGIDHSQAANVRLHHDTLARSVPDGLTPGMLLHLQRTVGNRAVTTLTRTTVQRGGEKESAEKGKSTPKTAPKQQPNVLPRVHVERDPKIGTRLHLLCGQDIIGTVYIQGAGKNLEHVQVRDRTENHADKITGFDIQILIPPGATITTNVWRHSIAKLKRNYGISHLDVNPIEKKPPYGRDELQLWPPADNLGPIEQRHESTPDERAERKAERDKLQQLRKSYRHVKRELESNQAMHEVMIELKDDHPVITHLSNLLGGTDLPSRDIWNDTKKYLDKADAALLQGNPEEASLNLDKADAARRAMHDKVDKYQSDNISGAERAISGLQKVKAIGSVAASQIPGPLGKVFYLTYQALEEPPKSLEEFVDRLEGLSGMGGGGTGSKGGLGGHAGGGTPPGRGQKGGKRAPGKAKGTQFPAGHPEHKKEAWTKYQARNGSAADYTKWSPQYDRAINNRKSGKRTEEEVLEAYGHQSNSEVMIGPGEKGGFRPDAVGGKPAELIWEKQYDFVEIKDWKSMSETGNLAAMIKYVGDYGGTLTVYARNGSYFTGPLRAAFDKLGVKAKLLFFSK